MINLKNLDLNLLVVFEAVFSSGNISQAAKTLGMSQPTISNALGRLRGVIDDPLFVRAGRGVEPTPKAVQMIGPIRDALNAIQQGVSVGEEFDPATSTRHFRIITLDPLEPIVMPPIVRQVQAHRSVTLEVRPILGGSMVDALNDGSVDLVLANFLAESKDTHCEAVAPANLVMVARKDHPAIAGEFTLDHFQSLGHIALVPELRRHSRLDESLRGMKIDRHVVYSATKFWAFPHMLMTTDLVAILPAAFARVAARVYPLAIYPVPFDYPREDIYMSWKVNRDNDAGHRWLRQQIVAAITAFAAQTAAQAQ